MPHPDSSGLSAPTFSYNTKHTIRVREMISKSESIVPVTVYLLIFVSSCEHVIHCQSVDSRAH